MKTKTIETITRHLKGIVAALDNYKNNKVDINFKSGCISCKNELSLEYGGWDKLEPFQVECSGCNTKQEIYPEHRKIDTFSK